MALINYPASYETSLSWGTLYCGLGHPSGGQCGAMASPLVFLIFNLFVPLYSVGKSRLGCEYVRQLIVGRLLHFPSERLQASFCLPWSCLRLCLMLTTPGLHPLYRGDPTYWHSCS